MNCEQCVDSGPFLCGPVHAARALAAGAGRFWRTLMSSLAALG